MRFYERYVFYDRGEEIGRRTSEYPVLLKQQKDEPGNPEVPLTNSSLSFQKQVSKGAIFMPDPQKIIILDFGG